MHIQNCPLRFSITKCILCALKPLVLQRKFYCNQFSRRDGTFSL